jgi:hypothetical protein
MENSNGINGITEGQRELFEWIRFSLGAPVLSVELTDSQLCMFMKYCIADYRKTVQNWLIESQWPTLAGKNILSNSEVEWALTMRTFDYSKDYANYFSKNVGLQQTGSWEMKKDYFTVEKGKQSYLVPAGREINQVLYVTPNTTSAALYATAGGLMGGFAGLGMAQMGATAGAWGAAGIGGFPVPAAYDITLLSSDLNYKQKLFGGELVYKVTAGPEGTHIIHLLSTPGHNRTSFDFGGVGMGGVFGLAGCEVWYTYYDTTPENAEECRKKNKSVLLTPEQVPVNEISYDYFNEAARQTVAELMLAKSKQTIAYIRGKYSGSVKIQDAEMNLDYSMLAEHGREEYKNVIEELRERLARLMPDKIMEREASIAESNLKIVSQTPMGIYVF